MKKMVIFILFLPLWTLGQEQELRGYIHSLGELPDAEVLSRGLNFLKENEDEENGPRWLASSSISSEDSVVRTFQFVGEFCGAYCNPHFETILIFPDLKADSTAYFSDELAFLFLLKKIYPMNQEGLYLALGTSNGRPRSIESVRGKQATLFSIKNGFDIKWEFASMTSTLVDIDNPKAELNYDPKSQTIEYEYDYYEEEDLDFFKIKGKWKFNGDTFELVEERRTEF